jgi:hypothetical protein
MNEEATTEDTDLEIVRQGLKNVRDELSRALMYIDTATTIVNQRISGVQCCASDYKSIGLLVEAFNETQVFIKEESAFLNWGIEKFDEEFNND